MRAPETIPAEEALYLKYREQIECVIQSALRQARLAGEDAKDCAQSIKVKLLVHDSAALRKAEAATNFAAYLAVVVQRAVLDWKNARWGKYRTPARVTELGPDAVVLHRLLYREKLPFEQAGQRLPHCTAARLVALREELGPPPGRRFEDAEPLERLADPRWGPEEQLEGQEAERELLGVRRLLHRALQQLSVQDRQLFRERFVEGLQVVKIARRHQLDATRLYRHYDRLLGTLRSELEKAGVRQDLILKQLHEREAGGKSQGRPSLPTGPEDEET